MGSGDVGEPGEVGYGQGVARKDTHEEGLGRIWGAERKEERIQTLLVWFSYIYIYIYIYLYIFGFHFI